MLTEINQSQLLHKHLREELELWCKTHPAFRLRRVGTHPDLLELLRYDGRSDWGVLSFMPQGKYLSIQQSFDFGEIKLASSERQVNKLVSDILYRFLQKHGLGVDAARK